MPLGRHLVLYFIHLVHSFISLVVSCWTLLRSPVPLPLRTTRRRIPKHLALLFVPDSDSNATRDCMAESVSRIAGWSRSIGVEKLTLYDTEGWLVQYAEMVAQRLHTTSESVVDESSSDVEYPLTPPLSDCSDSRPVSPENALGGSSTVTIHLPRTIRKRASKYGLKTRPSREQISQRPLTLCIASRDSGKPSVAVAASVLARRRFAEVSQPPVSVESFNIMLEGADSVSAPDFLIIHHMRDADHSLAPLELYGFPPWQIRLTEIHHIRQHKPWQRVTSIFRRRAKIGSRVLTEIEFRAALDDFAGAEMRFGR